VIRSRQFWPALLLALLTASSAFAQRTTASLRGTVTDQTHAIVPGVTVTVTNTATGFTRTTVTNAAGLYSVPELPVGTYRVDAELSGFKKASQTDVVLNVADDRAIDFELQPGAVSENVTVQATSPLIRTVGGDVSGVITGVQVRELPLNGRNFLQLATLMPGVSAPDFLNVKDKGLLGGSDLSVSGSSTTANIWTVDGANNNDVGSNRTILVYPSQDAIEEFKILRNSYGPEFGGAGGAHVNIVTRSGTNLFTGSLLYFNRNDKLNATNYFLEKANQPKEHLQRNDYGGTLGGPIVKDRLHFFYSQEWNREKRGTVRAAFVPTAAELGGDFSAPPIAGCTPPTPIDPLTGAAFPGNRIPSDRLSRPGQLFLSLYALPNTTPAAGSCNNWVQSLDSPINWRQENVRVDYTLSNTSRLMVRYTQDAWQNNAPDVQANLWGDDPYPAVDSNWDQPGKSFVAQLNQNIGSRGVNSLQFSYSANKITVTRGGTNPGLNDQVLSSIPTLFPNAPREYPTERSHPVFWGGQGYGPLWNEAPFHNNQDLFIFKDDYSAVFGKHLVKVGGLGSFNKKNEDIGSFGGTESGEFWGSAGVNGWGTTTGNILADFLLKDMTLGFDENSVQFSVPQRWRDFEGYASDSWKASPRVTLDYGFRYSLFMNPYAADNRIASFDPAAFNPALGADPCNGLLQAPGTNWCQQAGNKGGGTAPNRSLYPQDHSNFAPRLGVAWDLSGAGTTVVRAGLGQFYLRERLSPELSLGGNPPFKVNVNGIRKLDTPVDPCACFSTTGGAPGSGREQRAITPNNWQWNIALQREIIHNTTLEVAYVGNRGHDLLQASDVNQVGTGDINHNGIADRLEYVRSQPALADVRPYGVFGDARIAFWQHTGHSMYNSLQTQLVSRFGHGSQFQMSYTLSRLKSTESLTGSSGGLDANEATVDLSNRELDYGRAEADRLHIFNTALVLALPTLEGHSPSMRNALGDWEIGLIASAGSGQALTVHTGSIPGLNGGPSGTGYTDNQRPNLASGQSCSPSSGAPPEQILNPAMFTLTGFQLGTIGNSPRGVCDGPGYFQTDLAFYKMVTTGSRVKLQLRVEVFNVFNRTNFLGTGGAGVITTMNPSVATLNAPRESATTITGATLPGNFGQAVAARDPRQAQLGFKLLF
jgi:Carboxypeptidase regulatory-like domain